MKKLKSFLWSKGRYVLQCSAFMVAVYAANTSCILIFHQTEMPKAVQRLGKFHMNRN